MGRRKKKPNTSSNPQHHYVIQITKDELTEIINQSISEMKNNKVHITVYLVELDQANASEYRISMTSPLGKALIGKA